MCLCQYDSCIKDCDKAVERDRKLRPGTEQLCRIWNSSATAPHTLSSDAHVFCSELRPKRWRARVETETEGWIDGKPVEGNLETDLERDNGEGCTIWRPREVR